jgi:hypothetical protein
MYAWSAHKQAKSAGEHFVVVSPVVTQFVWRSKSSAGISMRVFERSQVDAYSARGQFTQLDQKVGHFSGIWLNEVGRDRQAREGQGCDCRQTHVGMQGLTAVRIVVKTLLGYQEMDFREWKIQSRAWT